MNLLPNVSIDSNIICLACPVSGLPQDSNAMLITGDYIHDQSVTLECNAGYVIDTATECTCDTNGQDPTWNCAPDNMISCVASK